MKRLVILLLLVGSTSYANNSSVQEEVADYKVQACVTYSQVKGQLDPFLNVKQVTYMKNADGSFKAITGTVPNTALYQAMLDLHDVCTNSAQVTSMDELVGPLNRIRNNIWDAQIQTTLGRVLDRGFEVWSRAQ